MVRIKDESHSAAACTEEYISPNITGPLHMYFEASMRRFSKNNAKRIAKQSTKSDYETYEEARDTYSDV